MTDRDTIGGTTPTETPTSNASTDAPGAASTSTGYIAELSQLKRDLAEEFERLRTAKLDDFANPSPPTWRSTWDTWIQRSSSSSTY